jgi:putative membrane protein
MKEESLFEKKPLSLINALKGIGIGLANIIPGVSGGTIAVVTGLYDELVDAFGNFFRGEGGWKRNLLFLLPVVAGILAGNVAFARLIGFLLESFPEATTFGFIGLILGSAPYLVKRAEIRRLDLRYLLFFGAGMAAVIVMGLSSRPEASPPITEITLSSGALIFGAAFIGSIAMIIPGVSGSFLLLLIGMYSTLRHGFSTLNLPVIVIFVAGSLVGVVLVSKGLSALLRSCHRSTYAVIIGLVIGSAITLYPGISSGPMFLLNLGAFAFGALLSLLLGTDMKERLLKGRKTKEKL